MFNWKWNKLPLLWLQSCVLLTMAMGSHIHAADLTLIVPYVPGGPTSELATRLAEGISVTSGKTVEVRNNGAGGGLAAVQEVAKAPKDGSVLLVGDLNLVLALRASASGFDLVKDFDPAATIGSRSLALITSSNGKIKNLQQARSTLASGGTLANNGTRSLASACIGLLAKELGLPTTAIISYRGSGPMIADLRSGHVDLACVEGNAQFFQDMTILGITEASSAEIFHGVPTLPSQGVPVKLAGMMGLFAPKGTPESVLDNMQMMVTGAISLPDLRSYLINQLLITPE